MSCIYLCPQCGQFSGDGAADSPVCSIVCATCRAVEREPQGEAMALFTPAPAPMPGQITMDTARTHASQRDAILRWSAARAVVNEAERIVQDSDSRA